MYIEDQWPSYINAILYLYIGSHNLLQNFHSREFDYIAHLFCI